MYIVLVISLTAFLGCYWDHYFFIRFFTSLTLLLCIIASVFKVFFCQQLSFHCTYISILGSTLPSMTNVVLSCFVVYVLKNSDHWFSLILFVVGEGIGSVSQFQWDSFFYFWYFNLQNSYFLNVFPCTWLWHTGTSCYVK